MSRSSVPPKWTTTSCNGDFDIYVAPIGEDLGKPANAISKIIADTKLPPNIRINTRGLVVTMQSSFRSFGLGLLLAILLVYLILVAQFTSFIDPFLIVLAVPTGLVGVILTLVLDRHDAEHSIADGHRDAAGHGGLEQHPDRGFRQSFCARKDTAYAKRWRMPAASACGRF